MKDKNKEESLKYLGAIGGLLAAYGADAQITYVDVADTTLNTNNAEWRLNIDEDTLGVIDYRFIQYVDTSVFNVSGNFSGSSFSCNRPVKVITSSVRYTLLDFRSNSKTLSGPAAPQKKQLEKGKALRA